VDIFDNNSFNFYAEILLLQHGQANTTASQISVKSSNTKTRARLPMKNVSVMQRNAESGYYKKVPDSHALNK